VGNPLSAQAETFVKICEIRGQTPSAQAETFVPIREIRGQTPSTQAETHIKTKIDNISFQQTLSKSQALSNSNKDNLFYKIAQSSEFL